MTNDVSPTVSLRQLWAETAQVVERHEARWLCEVAAGVEGAEFVAILDEPVTERIVAHLDAMLVRYRVGEPLQYVLGRWAFRHLDLTIDRRVLIPRPETEFVAEVAIGLAAAVAAPRLVADLGTGSGAIGLALAQELPIVGTTVWITDASADALDVARANLSGIGRGATNVQVSLGSWFAALSPDDRFDVIVSNPPYVAVGSAELAASVAEWEPIEALLAGSDGLDDIRLLIGGAPAHLAVGGWLVLEIGADQGDAAGRLFAEAGYVDVEIRDDLAGRPRVALGRRPISNS